MKTQPIPIEIYHELAFLQRRVERLLAALDIMEHVLDCNQAADFKRLVRATRAADYDFCIEYHGKCGQFARETMEKK